MADSRINPDLTFDNFVTDESNEAAVSAAKLLSCTSDDFSLLFIHGSTGTGKTHLLHAIGCTVQPLVGQTHYRTCEDFVNGVIHKFKTSSIGDFRRKIKNYDVLLIDDIQLLTGKEHVQREFLNMLEVLARHSKKIAVSCDRPLSALQRMQEGLVDRFREGSVVAIQTPTHRLKATIVAKLAEQYQLDLPEELRTQIASDCTDIRQIEKVSQIEAAGTYRLINP